MYIIIMEMWFQIEILKHQIMCIYFTVPQTINDILLVG